MLLSRACLASAFVPPFCLSSSSGGTSCIYVFFGLYLLIGLIALNLACLLFVPLAKRYGWGAEGRLTRHLSRPRFEDEARKAS